LGFVTLGAEARRMVSERRTLVTLEGRQEYWGLE
jgi:hypothetical protein